MRKSEALNGLIVFAFCYTSISLFIFKFQFSDEVTQLPDPVLRNENTMMVYKRNSLRIQRIEALCRDETNISYPTRLVSNNQRHRCDFYKCPIHIMRKHKFSFCFMHKVASTTFQSHLVKLAGFANLTKREIQFHGHHLPRYSIRALVRSSFISQYKFLFVRHPFRRLVSAFYAKLILECQYSELLVQGPFCLLAKQIVAKYRTSNDADSPVTFREFVHYIFDASKKPSMDTHWSRIWHECQPCNVHYDFIGKIETADEDLNYLYRNLKIDNIIGKISRKLNRSGSEYLINECFSQINRTEFRMLYQIYEKDFMYFDYSETEFLKYVQD